MNEEEHHYSWSNQLEDLISAEAERCRGYAWINQQCEQMYNKKNNMIAIPVIVLSTLSGTASIGSSTLFGGEGTISSIVIGLVSISVGILNTISSFYSYSRKAEAHRIAYLNYSKLFSTVSVELSLPRGERAPPEEILKNLRTTMERLAETTPSAPQHVLDEFNNHFKDEDKSIARPIETNGLQRIRIYRVPSSEKNISISIEDVRPINRQQESEEGRSNPLTSLTIRSPHDPGQIGTRGTSSQNQSHLSGQEIGTTEI